ncbi:hypothetical protein Y032_0002g667 [Ancylostoma ceylanicum]|uniref:Uncharacterized protein n=1 Tax=Ancylostoma ceylanicum TaxID=53326 RepID=A0A016W0U8_9BILA|nr:hypothetical protein Y032_0002g667 [Ancylostoma ceylanicum]
MECLPRCDIPLPEIGAARVSTNFNACAQPAELSIRVIHEVRSVSTFLAGDRSTDSRKIGTEHWPLKLNVQFYEHSPEEYYAKACILTERTGQITCFMNSTYNKEALLDECDSTRLAVSSSLPMLLLTGMMIILFLTIGVGIVFLAHHLFLRFSRSSRSHRKFHKQVGFLMMWFLVRSDASARHISVRRVECYATLLKGNCVTVASFTDMDIVS